MKPKFMKDDVEMSDLYPTVPESTPIGRKKLLDALDLAFKDGDIKTEHVRNLMKSLGRELNDGDLIDFLYDIDPDLTGKVSKTAFRARYDKKKDKEKSEVGLTLFLKNYGLAIGTSLLAVAFIIPFVVLINVSVQQSINAQSVPQSAVTDAYIDDKGWKVFNVLMPIVNKTYTQTKFVVGSYNPSCKPTKIPTFKPSIKGATVGPSTSEYAYSTDSPTEFGMGTDDIRYDDNYYYYYNVRGITRAPTVEGSKQQDLVAVNSNVTLLKVGGFWDPTLGSKSGNVLFGLPPASNPYYGIENSLRLEWTIKSIVPQATGAGATINVRMILPYAWMNTRSNPNTPKFTVTCQVGPQIIQMTPTSSKSNYVDTLIQNFNFADGSILQYPFDKYSTISSIICSFADKSFDYYLNFVLAIDPSDVGYFRQTLHFNPSSVKTRSNPITTPPQQSSKKLIKQRLNPAIPYIPPTIAITTTRAGINVVFPMIVFIIQWVLVIAQTFAYTPYFLGVKNVDAQGVAFAGVGVIFSLTGIRSLLPGAPGIGMVADFASYFWCLIIAVVNFFTATILFFRFTVVLPPVKEREEKAKKDKAKTEAKEAIKLFLFDDPDYSDYLKLKAKAVNALGQRTKADRNLSPLSL